MAGVDWESAVAAAQVVLPCRDTCLFEKHTNCWCAVYAKDGHA